MAAVKAVAARSREDQGCVDYWWSEDLEQPCRFRFFECWESEEAFSAHQAQPYEHDFMTDHVSRIVGADAHVLAISRPQLRRRRRSPMRGVRNTEDGIRVVDADGDPRRGVRVSVASSGICGSDLHLVSFGPSPVTLGHEFCGRLDDGTPVAVLPAVRCGRCERCLAGQRAAVPDGPRGDVRDQPRRRSGRRGVGRSRPAPSVLPAEPRPRQPAWSSRWPWPCTASTGPASSPAPGCWSSGRARSGCAPSPRPGPSAPRSTWWPTGPTGVEAGRAPGGRHLDRHGLRRRRSTPPEPRRSMDRAFDAGAPGRHHRGARHASGSR